MDVLELDLAAQHTRFHPSHISIVWTEQYLASEFRLTATVAPPAAASTAATRDAKQSRRLLPIG
jgi:hypothetical protein